VALVDWEEALADLADREALAEDVAHAEADLAEQVVLAAGNLVVQRVRLATSDRLRIS
jgi:hypothetical protein